MKSLDILMVCLIKKLFNISITVLNMTKKEKTVTRQRCEVYSRVVGYIRPITQWNPGKQSEFVDRVTYNA